MLNPVCVLQSQYPAPSQLNIRTTKRRARARVSVKPCHRIRVALFPRQRSWIARRWWCPVRGEGWLRRGDRRPFRRACGTATSRRRVGRFDPADPFPNLPAGNSAGSWNAGGQAKRAYPAIRLCLFRPPSRPNRTTRADGSCACTAAAVVKGSDWLADTRPAKPREWRRCRDVVVGWMLVVFSQSELIFIYF